MVIIIKYIYNSNNNTIAIEHGEVSTHKHKPHTHIYTGNICVFLCTRVLDRLILLLLLYYLRNQHLIQ